MTETETAGAQSAKGVVVRARETQLYATANGSEWIRSTLTPGTVPGYTSAFAGWYVLAAGQGNYKKVLDDGSFEGEWHPIAEIYFIIAGSAQINLDGQVTRINRGDTVYIPAGCWHYLINDGDDDLEMVWMFAPLIEGDISPEYKPVPNNQSYLNFGG